MATHPSILAWRILWTEEPGGLQSMGSQRVVHDYVTNTHSLRSHPDAQIRACICKRSPDDSHAQSFEKHLSRWMSLNLVEEENCSIWGSLPENSVNS